jgi:serine protease
MKKILNIVCLFLFALPLYSQDISYIQGNTKVDLQIGNTGYLLEINNSAKAIVIQQAYKQQLNINSETIQVGQQYFLQINEGNPASVTAFLQNYQTDVIAISPLFLWKNDKKPVYFTGEIISTPQNGVTSEQILALFENGEIVLQSTSPYNSFVFKVKNYANLIAIQNCIQQSNLVLWSYPNHKADISLQSVEGSQDPRYFEQTYLNYIKAPEAWRLTTTCGSPVRVAVLDGGVPYPIKQATTGIIGESFHPDMIDKVVQGYTTVSNSLALLGNPMPYNGISLTNAERHGQFCAGFIAANHNNGEGIKGVAPNSVIVPVNIFANTTTMLDLARGIDWAWNEGQADILSNSWDTKRIGVGNPDIISAITRARTEGRKRKGCLVVFSSGNSRNYPTPSEDQDGDFVHFPANVDGVLAVGALNSDGTTVWNNSCISRTNELDLVAVGVDVITTNRQPNPNPSLNGFYTRVTGTSFSAPQVAGVAAMLLGAKSSLTEIELGNILTNTAQRLETTPNGYSQFWGNGIVHARRAMEQVVTAPLLLNRTDDDDFQTWLDKQVTRSSSSSCTPTVTFTMSDALFALGTCTWELSGGIQVSATNTGKTFEEEVQAL